MVRVTATIVENAKIPYLVATTLVAMGLVLVRRSKSFAKRNDVCSTKCKECVHRVFQEYEEDSDDESDSDDL